MIKTVIWDWNGTLLGDAEYGMRVINTLLSIREKPLLSSVDEYRSHFSFPVRAFYEDVGLGGDLYNENAVLWTRIYYANEDSVPLREGVQDAVLTLKKKGTRQAIVSASPLDALKRQVSRFPVLTDSLDALCGLGDIHAKSKVLIAQNYLNENGLLPQETLFVGDTDHDAEVAKACGAKCVLVAGGHQLESRLQTTHSDILHSFAELIPYIETL